jgi:hypothetical protein
MNKYDDLELTILSCLLQKPELMNSLIIEDKHFYKRKKIWLFMKSFYNKFGNFDLSLMYSICKNKYRIIEYIMWILEKAAFPSRFNEYQNRLIEMYKETKKEKYISEKIYEIANDLYVKKINLSDFENEIKKIYEKADKIFEKGVD